MCVTYHTGPPNSPRATIKKSSFHWRTRRAMEGHGWPRCHDYASLRFKRLSIRICSVICIASIMKSALASASMTLRSSSTRLWIASTSGRMASQQSCFTGSTTGWWTVLFGGITVGRDTEGELSSHVSRRGHSFAMLSSCMRRIKKSKAPIRQDGSCAICGAS